MSTFPTDAEREATERAIRSWTLDDAECIETQADTILDALAPLVADRERAAAARALREAADNLGSVTHGRASETLSHWPDLDRGIYELAIEEASGKIHERAEALEAGEGRG